jgi:autotransporter-associated beta strand protein
MRSRICVAVGTVIVVWNLAQVARAVDPPDLFLEHLDDFLWTGGGDGTTWQSAANWTPPEGFEGEFPDDPDRIDMDEVMIVPVEGANFSIALASDLAVNISGSDVTVASVKLGGTGTAVTTNITSSTNHVLVFENQELNDTITNPGDPMADPPIEPEPIWSFNQARALIWSTGTAGVGEENQIMADLRPNDDVDVEGDRDLHIYGDVLEGERLNAAGEPGRPTSLSSLLSGDARLQIHGNIRLDLFDEDEMTAGTQERMFGLNVTHGVVLPPDPQNPPNDDDEVSRQGIVDLHGKLLGEGWIQIGSPQGSTNPQGTVILRSDSRDDPENTEDEFFSGETIINRGNVVIAHDGAFGEGEVSSGNPTQAFGFNFISTDDARNIENAIQVTQWHTVAGATDVPGLESFGDHSIEFSGEVIQSNTRGWINMLPAVETLTLSGPQYPLEGGDNADTDRIYTMDGSGMTMVTGGIHNRAPDGVNPGNGHFRKRGSGTVVIDYDESNMTDTATNYVGYTFVQGGNLHFATNTDLPDPGMVGTPSFLAEIASTGGAVGVDSGVVGNSTFLTMLNNVNNPNHAAAPNFFRGIANDAVFALYDSGGLMLASGEYNQNLDFNTGDLARAANMTLAAREGGSTYSGTITPNSSLVVNPDTYQLGGGAGTLLLNVANQLTGARSLLVTNGGEVQLPASNNYTGTTRVVGKFETSNRANAAASLPGIEADESENFIRGQMFRDTTLTITNLSNGGLASSIGSALSDAANLLIQNATLKYVGPAVSTNRLFTVGTGGATIDASGTGALNFTNSGALGIDIAEDRLGAFSPAVPGAGNNEVFGHPTFVHPMLGRLVFSTEDLVPGMAIRDVHATPQLDSDLIITGVVGDHAVTVGEDEVDEGETPWAGVSITDIRTITFGPAPPRALTLTGTNAGNNTLASLVANASDGGVVGVTKSGDGKWILSGANTYTGNTSVEDGILSITNAFLANAADVLMTTGGVLDLNFVGTDVIDELFFNETAQAAGTWGAIGNLSADHQSAFFTGTGLLEVTTAPDITGDYNNDGIIDLADYVAWRKNPSAFGGDPAGYDAWRMNFGSTPAPGGGSKGLGDNPSVPEPTGVVLLLVGAIGMLVQVARRR